MKKCLWCFVAVFSCFGVVAENNGDIGGVIGTDSVVSSPERNENISEDFTQTSSAANNSVLNEDMGKNKSSDVTVKSISNKDTEKSKNSAQISNNRFDIAAKKIAGISSANGDIPGFKDYSEFIQSSWDRLYQESISHISSWAEKHLKEFCGKYDTLFYPFGGPDVSYAVNFFPNAKRYILVGLEPLGNFDQIERNLSNKEYYDSVRTAFSHYLRKGYFITSEMQTQLYNASVKGGLNLILLALKKLEFNVLEVKNFSIDANGNISDPNSENISCIRITCEKNSERK